MVKGLEIGGGNLKVFDGDRVAFTTEGTLVNLLPGQLDLTLSNVDLVFPDFTKSDAYYWSGSSTTVIGGTDTQSETCSTAITVVPTSWNNFPSPLVLGALPAAGIDFLDVLARPRRINSPSNWMGQAIPRPLEHDEWLDMSGSAIVEQALGMTRAVTVAISGGSVVLLAQQSVCNAPTGYITNPASNGGVTYGANGEGLPVWHRHDKSYLNQPQPPGGVNFAYRRNGGNPCLINDVTNYSSTWRFDFRIAFGRRSHA